MSLQVLAVKVADDVLIVSRLPVIRQVVEEISSRCKIGTIVYTPGSFLFIGLCIKTYQKQCELQVAEMYCRPVPNHWSK